MAENTDMNKTTDTHTRGPARRVEDYDRWTSLPEAFFDVAALDPEKPMLWSKQGERWTPLSRGEIERAVRALSGGLRALGLEAGERVVLVAENRPEFLIADLAIMAAGAITVPAYTTNTEADHAHILEDSQAAMAIVSTDKLAQRLLPPASDAPDLRLAITMEELVTRPEHCPDLQHWDTVISLGRDREDESETPAGGTSRDDVACIIYTSGTGGAPKGVMLTHGNILSNCRMAFDLLLAIGIEEEIFLSFLPLSHSYEHTAGQFFPLTIGAQIYYSQGVEHLLAELAEVRPTITTAVPRLYETTYQRVTRAVAKTPPLRQKMFWKAEQLGRKKYHQEPLGLVEKLQDRVLDRLVRDKVRARFGGRLKGMISGGAALDTEIGIFFTALGLRILQGYGQTEAAPVVSCNPPHRPKLHTVGPPLPGVEVKLAEDGELLVRGPMVMKGYWRMPEHTAETVVDGWLHTGDLARIDEDGYIEITDRKKDILVLSGGDTLSPARIEGFLTREREIAQAMVYGDRRRYVVALIVPDEDFMKDWAQQHGKPATLPDLAEDPEFHKAIGSVVARINAQLSHIEKVRNFTISNEPFTLENHMMTPTLKNRRHVIKQAYGKALDALY